MAYNGISWVEFVRILLEVSSERLYCVTDASLFRTRMSTSVPAPVPRPNPLKIADTVVDHDPLAELIRAARDGSSEARGQLLEACRNYLLLVANQELPPGLQPKVAPSDLVQLTFLKADDHFVQFAGHSRQEWLAWLRQILLNSVADVGRQYYQTGRRQLDREMSLDDSGLAGFSVDIPLSAATPSERMTVAEEEERVLRELDKLAADYRTVILLRHREGLKFGEIAARMNRSTDAARKLWLRAIEELRQRLERRDDCE